MQELQIEGVAGGLAAQFVLTTTPIDVQCDPYLKTAQPRLPPSNLRNVTVISCPAICMHILLCALYTSTYQMYWCTAQTFTRL